MVRLLVIGDLHYRGTSPRARKDDFPAALRRKLAEAFDLARSNGCLGIVIPGDIVDTPGIVLPTLVELCLILAQSPCPIYAVPGNHDLWGGSFDTVARTPYGALREFGLIRDLSSSCYMLRGISLTGRGYDANTDRDISQYTPGAGVLHPRAVAIASVHVAHGMLLQREPGYVLTRYTLASEVAELEGAPDVLVVGHEHAGFGVVRLRNTVFVNPGALCRLSASSAEMSRRIQVCLLTFRTEVSEESHTPNIEAELVPIESARDGSEVLSRSHLQEQVGKAASTDDFIALLETGIEGDKLEIRQVIDEVAQAQKAPREVVEEALRRVAEASESTGYESSVL